MQDLISPMLGTPKSNAWRETNRNALLRQDLPELKEHISDDAIRETIMQQWDYWRAQIAAGDESSAPRDWFESVLDMIEEER